jgi:hypothetical protein
MSIEIYDNAKIVKKDNKYYYFLKYGSKNCFTIGGQTIIDNNFDNKFIKRNTRDSFWHIIAIGEKDNILNDNIVNTYYNSPKFYMYGDIRFGNKNNIALYFVRNKNKIIDYDLLNDIQKANIDNIINYYTNEAKDYVIDLNNIKENEKTKDIYNYCGKDYFLKDFLDTYCGFIFWNCNVL